MRLRLLLFSEILRSSAGCRNQGSWGKEPLDLAGNAGHESRVASAAQPALADATLPWLCCRPPGSLLHSASRPHIEEIDATSDTTSEGSAANHLMASVDELNPFFAAGKSDTLGSELFWVPSAAQRLVTELLVAWGTQPAFSVPHFWPPGCRCRCTVG